jgi:hypothetical protein
MQKLINFIAMAPPKLNCWLGKGKNRNNRHSLWFLDNTIRIEQVEMHLKQSQETVIFHRFFKNQTLEGSNEKSLKLSYREDKNENNQNMKENIFLLA